MSACNRRVFLRHAGVAAGALALPLRSRLSGPDWPVVRRVEVQPLLAQVRRLVAATSYLGSPLRPDDRQSLEAADKNHDAVAAIQRVLDPYCLLGLTLHPGAPPVTVLGPAEPELVQHGWRQFLVKVHNAAGVDAGLRAASDAARPLAGSAADEVTARWLDLMMFDRQPLAETLSGLALEYRILQLYSRDAGQRRASLAFELVWPEESLGPSIDWRGNEVAVRFDCRPAQPVRWRVRDESGRADRCGVRDPRPAGTGLPLAGQAARTRLRLPPAGVSRRRRRPHASRRRLHRGVPARPGVAHEDAGAGRRGPDLRRPAPDGGLPGRALDRPREAGLVVRRPSHPRRGLRPLHQADRGRPRPRTCSATPSARTSRSART